MSAFAVTTGDGDYPTRRRAGEVVAGFHATHPSASDRDGVWRVGRPNFLKFSERLIECSKQPPGSGAVGIEEPLVQITCDTSRRERERDPARRAEGRAGSDGLRGEASRALARPFAAGEQVEQPALIVDRQRVTRARVPNIDGSELQEQVRRR